MTDRLRSTLVAAVLVSVTVNASLAVWALLADDFGDMQGRVLITSFFVTGAMLGVLVNGPALRSRPTWPLPIVAAVAPVVGFVFLTAEVWSDGDNEFLLNAGASGLIIGAAATLGCAVRLVPPLAVLRLPQLINAVLMAALTASLLVLIWFEIDSETFARLVGIESVLVAAFVIAIPVVARFATSADEAGATTPEICPHCGAPLDPATGRALSEERRQETPA